MMDVAPFRVFDPLFGNGQADAMVRLCEDFGCYGMYSEEGTADDWGTGLPQRFDAAFNFVGSGGRFARSEPAKVLAARTNYFRETYAYRDKIHAPAIEPFHHFEGFIEAAREIHGRPIVRPAISYANLLVPGQELAIHTDVPEFRGMNRMNSPQWLLVAMHHSGLFERWRMPIATAVSYFGHCTGGDFAFYPEGADGPPQTIAARHDTAVVLDTDSVFHGVDRVRDTPEPMDGRAEARGGWGPRPTPSCATPPTRCASPSRGRRTATRTRPRSARRASTATTSRASRRSRRSSPTCASAAGSATSCRSGAMWRSQWWAST
jgi:hypothetical protein